MSDRYARREKWRAEIRRTSIPGRMQIFVKIPLGGGGMGSTEITPTSHVMVLQALRLLQLFIK